MTMLAAAKITSAKIIAACRKFIVVVLLAQCIAVPFGAVADPAYDFTSNATAGTGNLSWQHTPVGTPRGVVCYVLQNALTDENLSMTYGGDAMTETAESPVSTDLGEDGMAYAFFLGTSIPTGEQTVALSGVDGSTKAASCVTYTSSGGDTEINAVDSVTGNFAAGTIEVALTISAASAISIGFWNSAGATTAVTALDGDWTERYQHDFGAQIAEVHTYNTVAATTPVDVGVGVPGGSTDNNMMIVAISEVGGGGSTAVPTILSVNP